MWSDEPRALALDLMSAPVSVAIGPRTALGSTREVLEAAFADDLARHAAAWFPRECCALLVRGPAGHELILAENLADRYHDHDPETFPRTALRAYVLDPRLIAAAEREGKALVAIVHSHCRVGAYFSDEDVRQALSPFEDGPLYAGVDYVVLDARDDGLHGFRVFTWSEAARGFVER